jgi:hypothetical protein
MLFILFLTSCATLLPNMEINSPVATEPHMTPAAQPTPKKTDEPAGPEVTITGKALSAGLSRGKTIAAWNGIPSGQRYLVFKLDSGIEHPTGSTDPIEVWTSGGFADEDDLIGKPLTLIGKWKSPPEDDLTEMRQRPIGPIKGIPKFSSLEELEKGLEKNPPNDPVAVPVETKEKSMRIETVDDYVTISPRPVFWVRSFSVLQKLDVRSYNPTLSKEQLQFIESSVIGQEYLDKGFQTLGEWEISLKITDEDEHYLLYFFPETGRVNTAWTIYVEKGSGKVVPDWTATETP